MKLVQSPGAKLVQSGARATTRRRYALRDLQEQLRVGLQLLAEPALELAVNLADTALGEPEDPARLPQREVVDVKQNCNFSFTINRTKACAYRR